MLCPCIPGIADTEEALCEMFDMMLTCNAEDVWLEPVNARGNGLHRCATALADAGHPVAAQAMNAVRSRTRWNAYALDLVTRAQAVAEDHGVLERLHVLLYRNRFDAGTLDALERNDRGIVWL